LFIYINMLSHYYNYLCIVYLLVIYYVVYFRVNKICIIEFKDYVVFNFSQILIYSYKNGGLQIKVEK
jgi:hypothetical protein